MNKPLPDLMFALYDKEKDTYVTKSNREIFYVSERNITEQLEHLETIRPNRYTIHKFELNFLGKL